jgi:hypothetical protein
MNDRVTKWVPTTDLMMLRRMGKTSEECSELIAVLARVIIQGIDEVDPASGKPNRERLIDEVADVQAQLNCTIEWLGLNRNYITARTARKEGYMREWEGMFCDEPRPYPAHPIAADAQTEKENFAAQLDIDLYADAQNAGREEGLEVDGYPDVRAWCRTCEGAQAFNVCGMELVCTGCASILISFHPKERTAEEVREFLKRKSDRRPASAPSASVAGLTPTITVRYWADAFPKDPEKLAGGMIVRLLREYAELRERMELHPLAAAPGGGMTEDLEIVEQCLTIPEHKLNDVEFLRASIVNANAYLKKHRALQPRKEQKA